MYSVLEILQFDDLITEGIQTRVKLDEKVVKEYAKLMSEGIIFPNPVAYRIYVIGEYTARYFLSDGNHRIAAYKANGKKEAEFDVVYVDEDMSMGDAVKYVLLENVRANAKTGLPMSNADKKNACLKIIELYPNMSDRQLASEVGVDHKTVGKYRKEYIGILKDKADKARAEMEGGEVPQGEGIDEREETKEPPVKKEKIDWEAKYNELIMSSQAEISSLNKLVGNLGEEYAALNNSYKLLQNSYDDLKNEVSPAGLKAKSLKRLFALIHPDNYAEFLKDAPELLEKINEASRLIGEAYNAGK